jgi:pimeloyl-ACP methyl ester carboxylesterase
VSEPKVFLGCWFRRSATPSSSDCDRRTSPFFSGSIAATAVWFFRWWHAVRTMRVPEVNLLIRGHRERLVRQWRFQASGNSLMRIYFLPRNFFSRFGPNSSIKYQPSEKIECPSHGICGRFQEMKHDFFPGIFGWTWARPRGGLRQYRGRMRIF